MSLAAFESISVATVMPVIAPDLDGLALYSWAFTAYVALSLVGLVFSGLLCDRGHLRSVTIGGVAAFCIGSLAAGLAPSMALLIVGRAVQGFAAGILIVSVYVVVARGFPEDVRPRAFVLLSAAWVVPAIVGPIIAGWIAEVLGWRWVFLGVPVVVAVPAILVIPVLRRLNAVPDPASDGATIGWRRLRLAAGAALGLALLQDGLLRLGPVGMAEIVVGAVLLVALVPPLLPRGTFRLARGLPTTIALRGILAGAYFGAEVFIPLALVEQRGLSISLAGAALSVAAVGWFLGSFLQSRIPIHVDRARIAVIGCSLVTLGLLLLPLVLIDVIPVWWVAVAVGIESVGMGMVFPTLSVIMLRESLPEEQGFNSSALQFSDAMASVVAAGAAGAIHAAAVVSGEVTTWTFTTMWLMTAALALAGVLAAPRLAVRHRVA